ncbi:MAG: hypothetical protein S4CHLAM45_08120 [Chlamydiales bacterium]|nr:hypothetical protein [Chlamydiales bacterium]MCH9620436.1 hypothetical protein [Chlamydiales bacterium]MCH9622918.1 hypothetical protein [Chlamydiales bacterium]
MVTITEKNGAQQLVGYAGQQLVNSEAKVLEVCNKITAVRLRLNHLQETGEGSGKEIEAEIHRVGSELNTLLQEIRQIQAVVVRAIPPGNP